MFRSFWMGGYEGADHVNAGGVPLDMARASGHLNRIDEDYRRARRLGLWTLRESLGWRLCERSDGQLDDGRLRHITQAARRAGIQPLWTLMHYGVPDGVSLFDDALIDRFAQFAGAVARALRTEMPPPRVYTPINEISFLAWAATSGGLLHSPGRAAEDTSTVHSGYDVKRRLVRAALAGMAAIRAEDPAARFLHVEPLVHVAAPLDRPELTALARQIRDYQWQALDLLGGRLEPELGGHATALDWLGFNHYHSSQWEAHSEARLTWHRRDARRLPLHVLLQEAWHRYRRPLIVAETGHVGMGRAAWLHEVAGEARQARAMGVPLAGVCLYPLLDRPDWQDDRRWHRCGLWHVEAPSETRTRHAVQPCVQALRAWQSGTGGLLGATGSTGLTQPTAPAGRRCLLVLLPGRWEGQAARLQRLLRRLAGEPCGSRPLVTGTEVFDVFVAEPPSDHPAGAQLRRHALGPRLTLLALTGFGPGGWLGSAAPALRALRSALAPSLAPALAPAPATGPVAGPLLWCVHPPVGPRLGPQVRAAFPDSPLAWQPEVRAGDAPSVAAADADLWLCESPAQARAGLARGAPPHARPVLALPRGWPAPLLRPAPRRSYESSEVERLLGTHDGTHDGPRLLLDVPDGARVDPAALHRLMRALPGCRLYVLHAPDAAAELLPAACCALGELDPALLPALLHACDGLGVPACAEGGPELRALARAAGLPTFRLTQDLTLGRTADRILLRARERLTGHGRGRRKGGPRPSSALAQAHAQAYRAAELRLVTALASLLAAPRALPPEPPTPPASAAGRVETAWTAEP